MELAYESRDTVQRALYLYGADYAALRLTPGGKAVHAQQPSTYC